MRQLNEMVFDGRASALGVELAGHGAMLRVVAEGVAADEKDQRLKG